MTASIVDLGIASHSLQALVREFHADIEQARSGSRERILASKAVLARSGGGAASREALFRSYRLLDVVNRRLALGPPALATDIPQRPAFEERSCCVSLHPASR